MTLSRWAPVTGLAYIGFWIAGFAVIGEGAGDSDAEIRSYYADSGNRSQEIAGFFLIFAAIFFLLLFLATLRGRLRAVEREPKSGSTLAFGAGLVHAALTLGAAAAFSATAASVEFTDEFVVDPNLHRLISNFGYGLFVLGNMSAMLLVGATSVLAIRTRVLPLWFGWLGLLAAVALAFSIAFFPIFVLWGWVLLTSVLLIWRSHAPVAEPAGAASA